MHEIDTADMEARGWEVFKKRPDLHDAAKDLLDAYDRLGDSPGWMTIAGILGKQLNNLREKLEESADNFTFTEEEAQDGKALRQVGDKAAIFRLRGKWQCEGYLTIVIGGER